MKTFKEFKDQVNEITHIVHTIKIGKEDVAGEPIKISAKDNKDAWNKATKAVDKLGGHYIDKVVSVKEQTEIDEGFVNNVVKPLALTAAIAGATGVGSHLDKIHPSQFKSDNITYTIAHNPQDAQGRDVQKKTLNGKPHLVWQHKGQTFALPVNEETGIDEAISKALRLKHFEKNYGDKIKTVAITGTPEKSEKAKKKLSFLQHVKNNLDAQKFATESASDDEIV